MLIYEKDCNVFALASKIIESLLNYTDFGFCIDDKEILLRVRRWCDVLLKLVRSTSPSSYLTPMPASNRPVTESYER